MEPLRWALCVCLLCAARHGPGALAMLTAFDTQGACLTVQTTPTTRTSQYDLNAIRSLMQLSHAQMYLVPAALLQARAVRHLVQFLLRRRRGRLAS